MPITGSSWEMFAWRRILFKEKWGDSGRVMGKLWVCSELTVHCHFLSLLHLYQLPLTCADEKNDYCELKRREP